MKNWAVIAIFLAAMVLSAAAQQPVKSQPANPAEHATVALEKPMPQPVPDLNTNRSLPQASLKRPAEDLTEYQRELIESHNQQLKEHFIAQQQAGGWQRVFLKQLALQQLELPKATLQLNAAQRFITNFVFCERPLIAGQVSDFKTFARSFRRRTPDAEFVLEPRSSTIINGCSFGPDTGEVRLILNHDAGNFVALQVNDWSNSSIFATLEAPTGIPDQDAELVVVRKDGTQSAPMPVEFFHHRVAKVFKAPGHIDDLRVAADRHFTE